MMPHFSHAASAYKTALVSATEHKPYSSTEICPNRNMAFAACNPQCIELVSQTLHYHPGAQSRFPAGVSHYTY